jgi:hypothetical protein
LIIRTIANSRKDIVKAMEEIMGMESKYMGPPTFNYEIGSFVVDKAGNVNTDFQNLYLQAQKALEERGLVYKESATTEISIPTSLHTGNSLKNLAFLIYSKQYLINKSLGGEYLKINGRFIEKLCEEPLEELCDFLKVLETVGGNDSNKGILFEEEKVTLIYPLKPNKIKSYMELFTFMSAMALNQKRINPKQTIVENEKFSFRTWLIRLGFVGDKYKESRRILLSNLIGNAAFKTNESAIAAREKNKK